MERYYRSAEVLIEEARAKLSRLSPESAAQRMKLGAQLVDIRYLEQRIRDGDVPDAIHIHTNEAEWRCDPDSAYRDPNITPGSFLIILCNQGYQSSLVAAGLLDMGLSLSGVTDVEGGFESWKESGQQYIPYSPV